MVGNHHFHPLKKMVGCLGFQEQMPTCFFLQDTPNPMEADWWSSAKGGGYFGDFFPEADQSFLVGGFNPFEKY